MTTSPNSPYFKKILLKLSGESLIGDKESGIDPKALWDIASEIHSVNKLGIQIAIVIGGGNIFRGIKSSEYGIERAISDYMGMLATVINSLALKEALNSHGAKTIAMSALPIDRIIEPYNREKALGYLDEGKIVIFAGGTGNPYFTTDTAATLRAVEINAQAVLKASHVDGVYDQDPAKQPNAKLLNRISYEQVLTDKLGVIDLTAILMAMEHKIPIIVFEATRKGNIKRIISGQKLGTLISGADNDR